MNISTLKYVKNISTDGVVDILIYGEIGSEVSGYEFAREMEYIQSHATQINVRINSIGGGVIDGYSIVSSILNSKVPCHTYIDGLAASMAGVIAVCGEKVHMSDYGTLMLHNPSGGSDTAVLDLLKGTLVTIFKKRTTIDESSISDMMDKETWMNASQALKAGFIDEIITTNKRVSINQSMSLKNMVLIYNKLLIKPNMNLITNKLGLEEGATEQKVVETIDILKAENDKLKMELEAGKQAIADMIAEKQAAELEIKNAEEAAKLARATEMVDSFKVKEDEKEKYINLALIDFDSVKNLLALAGNTKAVKVFDAKNVATKKGSEDRSEWSIIDWQKKDHKGLSEIKNNMWDTYCDMYHKHYKVYPKK